LFTKVIIRIIILAEILLIRNHALLVSRSSFQNHELYLFEISASLPIGHNRIKCMALAFEEMRIMIHHVIAERASSERRFVEDSGGILEG